MFATIAKYTAIVAITVPAAVCLFAVMGPASLTITVPMVVTAIVTL